MGILFLLLSKIINALHRLPRQMPHQLFQCFDYYMQYQLHVQLNLC